MKLVAKNSVEMVKMRTAGRLVAEVLDEITPHVRAGVSTLELNNLCHRFVEEKGCTSATINYKGYKHATCISLNDVVCHGIPSEKIILKDGDILNIDVAIIKDGYYGDTSRMFAVGEVSPLAQKLMQATYDGMMAAIATVHSGSLLEDVGAAIEGVVSQQGFSVVRDYVGHGLGSQFHEDPQVLHYKHYPVSNVRLKKGLCFTIEPMINTGTHRTVLQPDGWTVLTADGGLSAQYEHSLAVTEDGAELLTLSPKYGTKLPFLS